jgi:hypothetical protein
VDWDASHTDPNVCDLGRVIGIQLYLLSKLGLGL